jgi:hypothetical protein
MKDQTNSTYVDKEGQVWTNIGEGISLTNFDGSIMTDIPKFLSDIVIKTINESSDDTDKVEE